MGTSEPDSYEILAPHYDTGYCSKQDLIDVPFYVDLARRCGGPVLEIACGTGRVLLPIAREGIEIEGVDTSESMLRVLRTNLAREPLAVRERVTVHEGDMRNFRLERKFSLVTIPFRPMQHMYTAQDQVAALTTAAFHLREDGRLAFDVFFPNFEGIPANIGKEVLDLEWTVDEKPRKVVRRYFRKKAHDKIQQTFSGEFVFRTYEGDNLILEETGPLKMSYYTYQQLRALFLLALLEPAEEYGSFAREPLDNASKEMIFVLRKMDQRKARVSAVRRK
ncbi:MAG: class I SAM-dependent methyltransferase [Candidatus Acidiferrales bacterium]